MYRNFFKRFFDIILSLICLIILSPLFLVIAILIRIFMGGPVIFKQERCGKGNQSFYILKFRTMSNKKDENGELLPDSMRRSAFGNFIRGTSLDELPELINILKGEMSFIGPRPLFPSYYPYYTEREKRRMDVRAGLVPPEVLSLDITPSWDTQLESEANYAINLNFITDVKVIFATFVILYKRLRYNYGGYDRQALSVERAEMIKERVEI